MPKGKRQVNKNKIPHIFKYISRYILAAFLLFGTFLGIILDLTYQGILTCKCCVCFLECVKRLFRFFGLTHADLWDFIISNIGISITLVGMFLTLTIDIYERSEKKIFGIPRKELEEEKQVKVYHRLRRTAAMCPLLMLIFVVLGLCASSYWLLFLSYIFFLLIYSRHRKTYDEEKMLERVCDKMLQLCVDRDPGDIRSYREYQNFLIGIYDNTRKENDWIYVQKLFFEFLRRVRKMEDDICFGMEYYFVSIVFGQKSRAREFDFFTVIERYIDKMEHGDKFSDKASWDGVLLWGMLAASIPYAKEEELADFLRNYSDFGKRSQYSIRYTESEISDFVIQKECAMLLVLLEGWLEFHDVREQETVVLIKRIYERGEKVFAEPEMSEGEKQLEAGEGIFDLYSLILLYEMVGDRTLDIGSILERFLQEKRLKVRSSLVSNLIEII